MDGGAGGKGADGRIGGVLESEAAKWNGRASSTAVGNVRTKRIVTAKMIAAHCGMPAE